MSENYNKNGFLKGLLLGAIAAGATYYFLNSTKEGGKIKKKIVSKADDILEDLSETVVDFEEKAEDFEEKALEAQEELKERIGITEGETKKEIKGKLEEISNLKKRGKAAAKVFFTKNGKPLSS